MWSQPLTWIKAVEREEQSVDVTHIGEPEFVVTYEEPEGKPSWYSWVKTAFVCLVTFFAVLVFLL